MTFLLLDAGKVQSCQKVILFLLVDHETVLTGFPEQLSVGLFESWEWKSGQFVLYKACNLMPEVGCV